MRAKSATFVGIAKTGALGTPLNALFVNVNTPELQGEPQYVRLLVFQATIAVDLPHALPWRLTHVLVASWTRANSTSNCSTDAFGPSATAGAGGVS